MRRRLAAAGLVVLALLATALTTMPARAEDGVLRLGACLAGGGQGDLLIVMDTSASLRESDPEDQRVEAVGHLLEQLATFVGQTDAKVDVAVAGFAHDFEVSHDWTALSPDSVGTLVDAVASYDEKDAGWETDYWTALNGARAHLAAKAGDGDCQALVWLSDGMFDLDVRDSADEQERYGVQKPYGPDVELTTKAAERALERAGTTDLCRAGGVADALRTQGVTTLAVGLQGGQAAGSFDLMKGVATGAGQCGSREGAGAFVLAQGIGDLFFAFDELADPDHPPISRTTPLCQGAVCPQGTHRFVVDPSILRVTVLGGSNLPGVHALLIAPDGTERRLRPGQDLDGAIAGGRLEARWLSEGVFSLQVERVRDEGWSGAWRVVFVDPESRGNGRARTNIRLYGDLEPSWPDAKDTDLVAGQRGEITVGLQRSDGSRVQPGDLPGDISLDATLVTDDGEDLVLGSDLGGAALGKPLPVDLRTTPAGPAKVRLALTYTTAAAGDVRGTTLEPRTVDYAVTIAPPPDYPRPPRRIDFGYGESAAAVTVDVPLEGKGCAWLANAETLTLPEGVQQARVSSATDAQGECKAGALSLTLTPDRLGSGLVSGRVTLMTRPDDSGAPALETTVPFSYEMERPLDQQVFWLAFVLVLLGGLLLPLLLLMLVKWWTARIPGQSLSLLSVSGPVQEHGSFLDGLTPDPRTIRNLPLAGTDRRSVTLNGVARLRTRAGLLRLTEPGHVLLTGQQGVTSKGSRLPLAVQDTWVALLDPRDPHHGPVEVVLLLSAGGGRLSDVLSDARAHVPDRVRELRSTLGPAPDRPAETSATDDWGPAATGPHDNW